MGSMPELPEVETIRGQLATTLEGRWVRCAWARSGPRWDEAASVEGALVTGVRRRGKFLILAHDSEAGERDLVVHLGMTGQLCLGGRPGPDPHVHVVLRLDSGEHVSYRDVRKFGRWRVTPRGDYARIQSLARMGPEPLSTSFCLDAFTAELTKEGAPVKARLLLQRIVGGLGNIYVDEALHAAGVHPARRFLDADECARLHRSIQEVLETSLAAGGTTFRDYLNANGSRGTNVSNLRVYGRAGQECTVCGSVLSRLLVAGRSSVLCERCQVP